MDNTKVTSYSKGSKWLHWLVSVPVILMLAFSFFLEDVPERYQPMAYMIHKSLGLSILFLMLARIYWIVHTGKPALPLTVEKWERVLSTLVQHSLYFFLFAQTICGWIMSVANNRIPTFFGLFEMPLYGIPVSKPLAHFLENIHTKMAWILIALIVLHVAGAMKHYLFDKDNVMKRMLP